MTERQFTCPLCGRTTDTRTEVYHHLLVGHRKSAITDELLGTSTNRVEAPKRH